MNIFSQLGLLLVALVLTSGCQLASLVPKQPQDEVRPTFLVTSPGKGAMLVAQGGFAYRIGGLDGSGAHSAAVLMTTVDAAGTLGDWRETAPLPEGRSYGAAFAIASSAGNLLYVLGGQGPDGPSATAFFTIINPDGTLGFSPPGQWTTLPKSLPQPRMRAAWALHEGRFFLIGGETAETRLDTILQSRFTQGGQLGQWYTSPQTLPTARSGAASAMQGERLFVAGGSSALGIESEVVSYSVGDYGLLADRRIEAALPVPLSSPVLLSDKGSLIAAGGYGGQGPSNSVFRHSLGAWQKDSKTADAEGPSYGRGAGSLLFLVSTTTSQAAVDREPGLALAPEAPLVAPASGLVTTNASVQVQSEPGTTLRFRLDSSEVTTSDPLWNPAYRVSSDGQLSLRAFSAALVPSAQVHRSFQTRPGSFFVMVEPDFIPIQPAASRQMKTLTLQETQSQGVHIPQASAWYRIVVKRSKKIKWEWADADSGTAYTGRVELSLFELSLFTEALDTSGMPSTKLRSGTALHLELNPGTYFLFARDLDDVAGRNFGLAVSQE